MVGQEWQKNPNVLLLPSGREQHWSREESEERGNSINLQNQHFTVVYTIILLQGRPSTPIKMATVPNCKSMMIIPVLDQRRQGRHLWRRTIVLVPPLIQHNWRSAANPLQSLSHNVIRPNLANSSHLWVLHNYPPSRLILGLDFSFFSSQRICVSKCWVSTCL